MTADQLFAVYRAELNRLIANGTPFAAVQARAFDAVVGPLVSEIRALEERCDHIRKD